MEYKARSLTPDTPYLVHKYHIEGMPVKFISEILQRPESQIETILKKPLDRDLKKIMKEHFIKWNPSNREVKKQMEFYKIIQLNKMGYTHQEISDRLNVSIGKITYCLRKYREKGMK